MPSFQGADGTFYGGTGRVATGSPATGSTYTMKSTDRSVYFKHGATVAALTVKLPPPAQAGDVVSLKFNSAVTVLGIQNANGVVQPTAPVAAAQGQVVNMRYVSPADGWIWW